MKVNYKYSLTNKQATNNSLNLRQYEFDEHKHNTENNTIRPAKAVSFGGSAVSEATKIVNGIKNNAKISQKLSELSSKAGDTFIQNGPLNKVIDFVFDNEAAYNAIYSMLIAGILKPLLVLKTKDTDEKDKQMIATKNFLQAFLGSFLSFTISGKIIKKAVDITKSNRKLINISDDLKEIKVVDKTSQVAKELAEDVLKKEHSAFKDKIQLAKKAFKENQGTEKFTRAAKEFFKKIDFEPTEEAIKDKAEELVKTCEKHIDIFKKNPNFLKKLKENFQGINDKSTLSEAYDSFWKNIAGSPVAILKAKVASLLLPGVVAFIFAKKTLEMQQQKSERKNYAFSNTTLGASENFKNVQKQFENYLNKSSKQISFTGSASGILIDNIAKTIESASMSNFGEKAVNILAKTKKPSARMADIESALLTCYWVQNTARSKKIDPDQKLGLNIQSVLVTLVSSTCALALDTLLDGLIKKGENRYSAILQENISKLAQEIRQGKQVDNLKEAIKESCKKLNNPEGIAKAIIKKGININDTAQVKQIAEKLASTYGKKLSKFKSLTIFTLVVRFLVPVLMVKPAGKLKQKIKKNMEEKNKQIKEIKEDIKEEIKEIKEDIKEEAKEKKEKDD